MQKVARITLFVGFVVVAIFAQDCMNPLLNRTDIQARFGGSANILNTSRIAGNLSVCPFLSGQSVCVSDAGFTSLQKSLDEYKRSFIERSQKSDQKRYSGIGEAMKRTDMGDAKMKSMYTLGMLFNQTILSINASGASLPYNFTGFYQMVQQMGLTNNMSSGQDHDGRRPNGTNQTTERNESQMNGTDQTQSGNLRSLQNPNGPQDDSSPANVQRNWQGLQKNLMESKAKCAVSVMKHMYFASCMAASVNVTALNQSNITNANFTMSPDACSGFKSKCVDYFSYSAAAESTRAMMVNANSSFATQLYSIVTSGNDTTTIYDELNTLAATVLAEMIAAPSNITAYKSSSSLVCNTTNSNASDCDYICTKVLNTTGFDEDAFNSISSSNSTSRRRLDSSASIAISPSGANPEINIGDNDAAVVVSVSSVPDPSSGSKVFVTLMTAITSLLLLLSA